MIGRKYEGLGSLFAIYRAILQGIIYGTMDSQHNPKTTQSLLRGRRLKKQSLDIVHTPPPAGMLYSFVLAIHVLYTS